MNNLYRQIKQQLSITQVLSHYHVAKGRGKNIYHCPIHTNRGRESKPSLVASDKKGTATCLSQQCFKNDDIFSVIQKLESCDKKESLHKAATIAGISMVDADTTSSFTKRKVAVDSSQTKNLQEIPSAELNKSNKQRDHIRINIEELHDSHITWFKNRGIEKTVTDRFRVKAQGEYIAFPHLKEGKITGWKLRSIYDKKKCWQAGPEEGEIDLSAKLWQLEVWEPDRHIINHVVFVEGEPDCLYLAQEFTKQKIFDIAVLTSTAGANSVPINISDLNKYFPCLKRFSIFYDHDEAGKKGCKELASRLKPLQKSIHIYSFPYDKKEGYDITDFFNDKHTLTELFLLPTEIIAPYYEMLPAIDAFDFAYIHGQTIKTGILNLDLLTDGLEGLVILGGETGIGKTTFMLNLAYHAASNKHPVLYVSYEVGYTDLRIKLAAMKSNYNYTSLRKDRKLFLEARKVLTNDPALEYFKVIDSRLPIQGIDYMKQGILTLKNVFPHSKIPLLVVDYLQGMPINSTGDYRLSLAACVQQLRDLVRQQNIVVLTASATNTQRSGTNAIHPGVFRESSEIEYSAYIAMVLGYTEGQREGGNIKRDQLKYPHLFVLKNRFGPKNTKGIPLEVNWEKQIYEQKKEAEK